MERDKEDLVCVIELVLSTVTLMNVPVNDHDSLIPVKTLGSSYRDIVKETKALSYISVSVVPRWSYDSVRF